MKTYTPLQVVLIALLPKTGEGVTVANLARAAGITQAEVTNALFIPWHDKAVAYDTRSDCYSAAKAGNTLPAQQTT